MSSYLSHRRKAFAGAFAPTDITGCDLWLDASDNSTVLDATDAEAWLTAYHAHVLATPSKPPPSFCGHLGKDPNPRTGRTTEVKALTKLLQNGTLCPLAGPFDAGEGPSKQQTGWSNINLPLHLPSMALRRRAIRVFVYTSRIHCTDHRRGMDLFQAKLHALFEAERRRPTSKRFAFVRAGRC